MREKEVSGRAALKIAEKRRRSGDFESAREFFELALRDDSCALRALEAIAIIDEHRRRDFASALEKTRRAIDLLIKNCRYSTGAIGAEMYAFERTARRLERKMAHNAIIQADEK